MSDVPANGGTLKWRLDRVEQDIVDLDRDKATTRDVDKLSGELEKLSGRVESMTKALYLFSLTVAGSAVGLAFAVLQGGH